MIRSSDPLVPLSQQKERHEEQMKKLLYKQVDR